MAPARAPQRVEKGSDSDFQAIIQIFTPRINDAKMVPMRAVLSASIKAFLVFVMDDTVDNSSVNVFFCNKEICRLGDGIAVIVA